MTLFLIVFALGIVPGFLIGRWSAESGRARFDSRAVWNGRKRYRDG